jgi:hypothetical protein
MRKLKNDFDYIHQKTTKVLTLILLSKIRNRTQQKHNAKLREKFHEKRFRKTNLLKNRK